MTARNPATPDGGAGGGDWEPLGENVTLHTLVRLYHHDQETSQS